MEENNVRTASFTMSQDLFFELIGFKNFSGCIRKIELDYPYMNVFVDGVDDRLPESINFPDCKIHQHVIISRFEKI